MAIEDKKITELTLVTSLTGAELFEVVQGGVNKQSTINKIRETIGDDYVQAVVDTSGATATLDLESASFGNFSASGDITESIDIVLDNEERAAFWYFNFEVSDADNALADIHIDFGANTQSPDTRFVGGVFTPQDVGLHMVQAVRRYGTTTWLLTFKGVYSVGDAPPTPTDQWILGTGIWDDSEYWDDSAFWKDTP